MRLSLVDRYHQITYSLQLSAQYFVKSKLWILCPKKHINKYFSIIFFKGLGTEGPKEIPQILKEPDF